MKARVPANQSFFLPGECKDPAYKIIRDDPYYAKARAFVDSLWSLYYDLADRTCRTNARNDFLARFWEMYLAVTLRERGFELTKVGDEGPEFYFLCKGRKVWVEAVVPGPGDKEEDRVPDYFSREVTKIGGEKIEIMVETPVEKIILRFTNALDNKRIMYKKARDKGIIAPDDLYILAINSRGIPYASHWHTMDIPYFIQAIIPFGNQVLLWDTKTGEIDKTFYQKRENVIKATGEPVSVSTTAFLSPEFSFVSAVLHSGVYCFNHSATMGDEFNIFHNPSAAHPLDPSAFLWCDQRFYKDGQLEYRPKQAL